MSGECWTEGRPKRRYDSRSEARAAAAKYPDEPVKPYRCSQCGYFHLGHYPTSQLVRAALRSRHREAS
jgi:hypothetical protein